ncbi:response regulator [Paenibacillus agaridevorans]|uniref:response regulator n=1 Tax=Paenibacillus agaridevorans TaxID=171404 RepID=UPI001BE49EB2
MDGITAAKWILSNTVPSPRIIAVTGNTYDKNQCLTLGMVDFVEKPVNMLRIRQVIDSLIF